MKRQLTNNQRTIRDNRCASCGANLAEWVIGGERVVACGHNKEHRRIIKRGEYQMDSKALMVMDESKMLERVGMAKFPQELSVVEKKLLAVAAIAYGFDPIMGEISIYQGRPYVSIDGRRRRVQEEKDFDGLETRPATKEERAAWQIPDGDYYYRTDVYRKGITRPFTGWGRVRLAEINPAGKFKPVDVNPQNQAAVRSEAQAYRKAFHIPLPSLEDIGTPEDLPEITVTVGKKTDEIIDVTNPPPAVRTSSAPPMDTAQDAPLPDDFAAMKSQGDDLTTALNDLLKESEKCKTGADLFNFCLNEAINPRTGKHWTITQLRTCCQVENPTKIADVRAAAKTIFC